MASLLKLWESAKQGRDFWDNQKSHSELDDQDMQILTRGLEIRPDRADGTTFWDDFVAVIGNNSDGASHLLGVNRETVSGWSAKIKEGLHKIHQDNANSKTDMIKTGD